MSLAQSRNSTDGEIPCRYSPPPTAGLLRICTPACAPFTPAAQAFGAPLSFPFAYSSGYSPTVHTLPSLSWAKNTSSDSAVTPLSVSTSQPTRVCTPLISLTRSVTVNTILCSVGLPPTLEVPSDVNWVPGTSGIQVLVTLVGSRKLVAVHGGTCTGWQVGTATGAAGAKLGDGAAALADAAVAGAGLGAG